MDFDLISGYSVRVYWKAEFEAASVEVRGLNFTSAAKCDAGDAAVVIVNLAPSAEYSVNVIDKSGTTLSSSFVTSDASDLNLSNLYQSIRNDDGVYDTTRFAKELHDVFLANFSSVVRSGDKILANVTVDGVAKSVETVAVRDGASMTIQTDSNLFLPFTVDTKSSMQTVTLRNDAENATLAYDPAENLFGYGGDMYGVGDKFELFGKMVTVADGSIVLLFSDTVAKTWPFQASKALAVVGAAGSHFMKNISANVMNLVAEKADGEVGSTYNSAWVHNTTDSTTLEVSRMIHQIDEASENATISLGVLHTDASANQFIEPTLTMTYDATTISAQDAADATASATFQSTGLSFDTDDAAIYFGSDQKFRIKFSDGTPSTLQIQSYDSSTLDYVTRQEFSDSA